MLAGGAGGVRAGEEAQLAGEGFQPVDLDQRVARPPWANRHGRDRRGRPRARCGSPRAGCAARARPRPRTAVGAPRRRSSGRASGSAWRPGVRSRNRRRRDAHVRARSSAWMRSTSARISSTGASARPVTHQMTIAASSTITGSPIAKPSRRCAWAALGRRQRGDRVDRDGLTAARHRAAAIRYFWPPGPPIRAPSTVARRSDPDAEPPRRRVGCRRPDPAWTRRHGPAGVEDLHLRQVPSRRHQDGVQLTGHRQADHLVEPFVQPAVGVVDQRPVQQPRSPITPATSKAAARMTVAPAVTLARRPKRPSAATHAATTR